MISMFGKKPQKQVPQKSDSDLINQGSRFFGVKALLYREHSSGPTLFIIPSDHYVVDPAIHESMSGDEIGPAIEFNLMDEISATWRIAIDSGLSNEITLQVKEFLTKAGIESVEVNELSVNAAAFVARPSSESGALNESAILSLARARTNKEIGEIEAFPPAPEAAKEILEFQSNGYQDGDALVKIIERDPALSAQIVALANNAYYRRGSAVDSIRDAVIRILGVSEAVNIAVWLAFSKQFKVIDETKAFVEHELDESIKAAVVAARLSRRSSPEINPGKAYFSGLLSGFGALAMAHLFPTAIPRYKSIRAANPGLDGGLIGGFLLGVRPNEMSRSIFTKWGIEDDVVRGACDWEASDSCEGSALTGLARAIIDHNEITPQIIRLADKLFISSNSAEKVSEGFHDKMAESGGAKIAQIA